MQKVSLGRRIMRNKVVPLLIILIVMAIITMIVSSGVTSGQPFSALFTKGFMASGNLLNVFYNLVIRLVITCGLALIIMGGNIDLSVSAQATLGSMIFALICAKTQMPWGVAFVICICVGVCFGLANTVLVNKLRFPAFIATIGMSSIYGGICNVMTNGNQIQIARQSFLAISQLKVLGVFPITFLFGVFLIIVYQFVLSRTTFGRSVFMLGGNRQAARLSGLNPNRIQMYLFINNGVLAMLGGLLYSSQVKFASPTAIVGMAPDMQVISAVVLGGVSFMGGSGNMGGPLVAILLLNVFTNMLTILKVQSYWSIFVQGLLLAVALILDYLSEQRRRRAMLAGRE